MELAIQLLPLIIIFAVFWYFLIRPQRQKEQEHKEMVDNLEVGDKIVTIGGIKAKVIKIKEDIIRLRIATDVDIEVVKNAIGSLENKKNEQEE
ncbi:MAG: preprotein translocase subunit YajC [Halanaerobiales bacterium]